MRLSLRPPFLIVVALYVGAIVLLSAHTSRGQNKSPGLLDTPPPSASQLKVLDRLRGTWDVIVTVRSPQPGTMRYTETYEWVLDQRFLRGETLRKPDGTTDIFMATYDTRTKHYHFWIFTSQGTFVELPFGTWDEKTQSMEWKSGPNWDLLFNGRWTFPNSNTRRWTTTVRDWRGKILLDVEARAVRHP